MYKNSIIVNIHYGIHTRIAAMIVHKAAELKAKYNINLYIRKLNSKTPIAISMLALVSLKIKENEIIEISCYEDNNSGRNAVLELCSFITTQIGPQSSSMSNVDALIEESTIANEQILENLPLGIIIIDANSNITSANEYTLNLLKKNIHEVLGRNINDIIEASELPKVMLTKEKTTGDIMQINEHIVITNRSPIFSEDKVIGAIGVFQDISELAKKLENYQEELNYYKEELQKQTSFRGHFSDIIGSSGTLKEALIIAEKAAHSTSTVLIRGESGTGKELVAKAIHNHSQRKDKPFIKVNCAAIPENLLESELFGYEKGAFTGAVKSKPGKFKIADGGTIFLDEIGDMPKSMQVKLLRVLQEKEFESIGGLETHKVDVRVLAATNRNLEEMLKSGEFREDLYYRLNVLTFSLPPLRDRKEDISLLAEYFIKTISTKLKKTISGISAEALQQLEKYHWPGNIREFQNIIERAINMCDGNIITSKDLPFYIANFSPKEENLINLVNGELLPLEEYEKELITIAMKKYKSYNKAGKALGLTHRTVALKCEKYGIVPEK
ncbi:sigma 54-interacting transcriptional regulator [Clostridium sp. SYSU_GA19001]|uniref:sigma 54-interacting transcriptional regulator n=1 Tax=Clostridium caldaquaticum TaxID=2940653 RepID=UPI00207752B2|nr:sigma 54-interacting transcriptional regulator [Clostridium caldaquaticum]MCM8710757.1 sigma 54-interacting transcriptional regulator [Clostridium caldaquaticum]